MRNTLEGGADNRPGHAKARGAAGPWQQAASVRNEEEKLKSSLRTGAWWLSRATPDDPAQVLLAAERVVVGPWPGRRGAADRLVAVEGRLHDALAPGERRDLLAQPVHHGRGDVSLERAPGAAGRRHLR